MKNLQQKYENLIICYLGAEEVLGASISK